MAAFTSAGTGNWNVNGTWTTAGYPGDGVSGVNDTYTIANTHVVTMPWGVTALPAIVGAGTINLGGELAWAAGFTSAFSIGNITVTGKLSSPSDANAKVLWMGNASTDPVITVSNANTAEINLQKSMKIYFQLLTKAGGGVLVNNNGKITMEGTSSANKDCMVQGVAGKEPYVVILGNTTSATKGGLNNVTFDRCGRQNTTYLGSLTLSIINLNRLGQFTIGNIDVTNTPNGDYSFHAISSYFPSTAGTITATATNSTGIFLITSIVDGGTFIGTSTSSYGGYISSTVINGGTFTFTSTSSQGAHFSGAVFNAGTMTATSSSNIGLYPQASVLNGGTIYAISSSSVGAYLDSFSQYSGILDGTSSTSVGIDAIATTLLAGGKMDAHGASGVGGAAFYSANFGFSQTGGKLIMRDSTSGFNLSNSQGVTYKKTGIKGLEIYGNTAEFINETLWYGNEPLIYRNSATLKTCKIYFPCSPYNNSEFSFAGAGSVDYGVTTAGSITITGAGVLTFPQVQPWDVAGWTAITYTVSGGNSPVYEYRYSTDNGSSWSAWTAYTTPGDLTGISCGLNGNDIIQLRATNGAGASALTLTNFTITFSYSRETSPEYSEDSEGPLFYPTYAKAGTYISVWATMPDDATSVIVTLYKDDGTTETLTSATATQQAGTAQWRWSTSNITTQPTTITHYRVQFKDQNNNKVFRDLYLGGTEDDIVTTKINAGLIPALL